MPALDALDRERAVVVLTVSPLEQHGPHLPLGVDAFTARHFAEEIAVPDTVRARQTAQPAEAYRRRLAAYEAKQRERRAS